MYYSSYLITSQSRNKEFVSDKLYTDSLYIIDSKTRNTRTVGEQLYTDSLKECMPGKCQQLDVSYLSTKKHFVSKITQWGNQNMLNRTSNPKYKAFDRRITDREFNVFMDLFEVFMSTCEANNITYLLLGGTLLGSYRHMGMIPWDDDFDVLVNNIHKTKVKQTFESLKGITLNLHTHNMWKVYSEQLSNDKHWPFIDIFFFEENGTHIWTTEEFKEGYRYIPHKDVFPLRRHPFYKFLPFIPRRPEQVLNIAGGFDIHDCKTNYYSHKNESYVSGTVTVRCSELYSYFPFVINNELHFPE